MALRKQKNQPLQTSAEYVWKDWGWGEGERGPVGSQQVPLRVVGRAAVRQGGSFA